MNPIWNIVIGIIAAAAGALLTWLLETYKGVWQQRAFLFVNDVIVNTVKEVNQIYVDKRKEAETTGNLTFDEDEQIEAKKMCWARVWEIVPAKMVKHFYGWFGGSVEKAEAYVNGKIEATVRDEKLVTFQEPV